MNSDNYITTKEVAQRLNKSISTIYRYVNEKKLRPVYEDKWQIDSSLLFREEDVDRLIEEQHNKPGYTTGEVAAKLFKHPSTIAMYIKTGKLNTEKREYNGRILNFISEEELVRLQKEISEKEKEYLKIFDKQHQIYLYQTFHDNIGNSARIISLEKTIVAELEDGSRINIDKLIKLGFISLHNINQSKYITTKGFVHFNFRKPLNSKQLDMIEALIVSMGHKNVKIREEAHELTVLVKPGLLKNTTKILFDFDSFNTQLASGSLVQRHDGILLQTDYKPILTHVRTSIKDNLKHYSKIDKVTLDDYVESILEKHFKELN